VVLGGVEVLDLVEQGFDLVMALAIFDQKLDFVVAG
jgi:hypothetical protein